MGARQRRGDRGRSAVGLDGRNPRLRGDYIPGHLNGHTGDECTWRVRKDGTRVVYGRADIVQEGATVTVRQWGIPTPVHIGRVGKVWTDRYGREVRYGYPDVAASP